MSVRIHKPWFRSPVVVYDCPNCGGSLRSPVAEIGIEDRCPKCEGDFVVPGETEYEAYLETAKPPAEQPPADVPAEPITKAVGVELAKPPGADIQVENRVPCERVNPIDELCEDSIRGPSHDSNSEATAGDAINFWDHPEVMALERERREHAKYWQWGLYCSATARQAQCLGGTAALMKYMEVCYLDLNGANNSDPTYAKDREMLRLSPPWDKTMADAPLACCIPDRMGDMSKAEVKELFLKVAERVQKEVGCPVKPSTAWNKLVKAMREDGNW